MKKYSILVLFALCIVACTREASQSTPTETLKDLYAAVKAKDAAKIRETLSKKSVKWIEDIGGSMSLEEMLKKGEGNILPPGLENPEIRNEKITGEYASVETKSSVTGKWTEVPFVKEDGRWKVSWGDMLDNIGDKFKAVDKELETYREKK